MAEPIYKICVRSEWDAAEKAGVFQGTQIDLADGYIHFSTAAQVHETARRHFSGRDGLVLVAVDPRQLGNALKYEPSRGGDLFPHLYGTLDVSSVLWVRALPLAPDGTHQFPEIAP